jgi:hypothetical protein
MPGFMRVVAGSPLYWRSRHSDVPKRRATVASVSPPFKV